jgi:hypothetical protein
VTAADDVDPNATADIGVNGFRPFSMKRFRASPSSTLPCCGTHQTICAAALALLALWPNLAAAALPPVLASALEKLRDQRSYAWETINGDPGPITHTIQTRRGAVTSVLQNASPHVVGSVDLRGYTYIRRDWFDGLQLDLLIAPDGTMVTSTPEGWMTNQEIVEAQADERIHENRPTPRAVWLRRADRPDIRRPDEELLPLLKSTAAFEEVSPGTFVTRGRVSSSPGRRLDENDPQSAADVAITIHVHDGIVRDYEVEIDGSRRATRVTVPVVEHRIVILTHVSLTKVDAPSAAFEKLELAKLPRG